MLEDIIDLEVEWLRAIIIHIFMLYIRIIIITREILIHMLCSDQKSSVTSFKHFSLDVDVILEFSRITSAFLTTVPLSH